MDRPAIVTDEHLQFLDELRKSGVTNMFGAVPYLMERFTVGRYEAKDILSYWVKTYGQENR